MYRTDFWALWEKARVGCYERTGSKHVYYLWWKQIASPGWRHETSARAWCTGKTRRYQVGREGGSGWGIHVNPWLIHVSVWQKPLQYFILISIQLIKINGEIKKDVHANFYLEKEMASHSNILAWRILWIEEPGRLSSMGFQRVGQNWVAKQQQCSTSQMKVI